MTIQPAEPEPAALPFNQVIVGDCRQVLDRLPAGSVDLIFADPPYNLQLRQDLRRPDMSRVDAVDDEWDRFGPPGDFAAYDAFTVAWLTACRRVLRDDGTIWVIGTYHNIYRVGKHLQDLGFWLLNDVVWIKANPMPNFRGVRFTNAHETLLWAKKSRRQRRYTFNHRALRALNDDLQMRSDWWELPICGGAERVRIDGAKAHATQKPLALLYRVLAASTRPGDVVLDPFFGTGTTGVAAKRLRRRFIGIERDPAYAAIARARLAAEPEPVADPAVFDRVEPKRAARVPFGTLLEHGLLTPGDELALTGRDGIRATVMADGTVAWNGRRGSIHQIAAAARDLPACNGWEAWQVRQDDGWTSLNTLRERARQRLAVVPAAADGNG